MTSGAVRDHTVLLAIGAGVTVGAGVSLAWLRRGRRSEPIVVEVPEGSTLQVPRCMLPQLCDMVLHVFFGCPEYIWRPGKENEPLFLLSAGKDVTKEFKDFLRGGSVSANIASFGDPAPDREKVLVIWALPAFHGSFTVVRDGGQSQSQIPGDDEMGLPDGFNEAPLRPQHHVLRSMADPRLDRSLFVRYDPRPDRKTGAVIIVVPGGNYEESGINCDEGQPVALWLAALGITAVVLQYRCISEGHFWPAQFEDWKTCAQTVAAQAAGWGCDPSRIGVLGFSAGGHLAGYAALKAEQCARPKLQVLVYPCVDTLTPRLSDYMMPWRADQGYPPVEDSLHKLAHAEAPPAFLAGIADDKCCPASENTDVFAEALGKLGVPCQHVRCEDSSVEHGCGLSEWWTVPCEEWLQGHGWASAVE